MEVRRRRLEDGAELTSLAAAARELNGYPPRMPDLFSSPETVAAWIAIDADAIVGHIALHATSAAPVMALAAAVTAGPIERLVVVARLLVAPNARRRGAGGMLLDRAVAEAHARERWPVLDVAAEFADAIALYESRGWTCAGRARFHFRDGTTTREADSLVYIGPKPRGRRPR